MFIVGLNVPVCVHSCVHSAMRPVLWTKLMNQLLSALQFATDVAGVWGGRFYHAITAAFFLLSPYYCIAPFIEPPLGLPWLSMIILTFANGLYASMMTSVDIGLHEPGAWARRVSRGALIVGAWSEFGAHTRPKQGHAVCYNAPYAAAAKCAPCFSCRSSCYCSPCLTPTSAPRDATCQPLGLG